MVQYMLQNAVKMQKHLHKIKVVCVHLHAYKQLFKQLENK